MAKLPPIDVQVHWIRDLLHRGRRQEALDRLKAVIATGKAGKPTLELAEYLSSAKRGRQPFGAKHLWPDIGAENDEFRSAGVPYEERLSRLGAKFMLDRPQVATAIAQWESAMDEIRAIDENSRP
jgi:hypothetical protein